MRQLALSDALTGLPNRGLTIDRVNAAVSRRQRHPGCLALLFVDLDRFKGVNDALGHAAGDQVLIAVAARITSLLRASDTVGRYGGDEFVVLCEDVAQAHQSTALAERIGRAITAPIQLADRCVVVTASIGIAMLGERGGSAEALLRNAEAAMFRAKQLGGDRSQFGDGGAAMPGRSLGRHEVETDLRTALGRTEFRLAYQPTIDLGTGRASGAEALIRWRHPERGDVQPLEFIPLAEQTGLIIPIGAWVLAEACRQLRAWRDTIGTLAPASVSVNISGRQLAEGQIADLVAALLAEHNLDPASLCLEITESVLMDDSAGILEGLEALRKLGVRLSIDDFGTGYSSLLYLRRFPVNELKIDRLFVAGLGRNPEDTAIVEAVIALAHALKLTVVAEGVETADQVESLRHLGSDVGQGYYWSHPLPPTDLGHLLSTSAGLPGPAPEGERPRSGIRWPARLDPDTPGKATSGPYRVLLIDDARPERELLRVWLRESNRFVVAGEAADGTEGVALAGNLHPDLVVLDISMPGMGGEEALIQILAASPSAKVVVLSGFVSAGLAASTLGKGASACLDKGVGPARLIEQLLDTLKADLARR